MEPNRADIEALAGSARWIERLARSLVADPHAAEDLAQDAWVAALTHERGEGRPLRRWFAAILRNRACDLGRGERRRNAKQALVARAGDVAPHDEVLARLEVHGQIVAAVRALDEPYRTAIALRYFEELAPPQIAARTGVSLSTVHTHLRRGLEKLRERLDREHGGGRREWLTAFAPLAHSSDTALIGALIVKLKTKLLVAAALLLLGSLAFYAATRGPAEPGGGIAASAGPDEDVAPEGAAGAPQRAELPRPIELAAPGSDVVSKSIHGIVIGVDDQPVAGVRVAFVPDDASAPLAGFEATSGADGAFTMREPEVTGALEAAGGELVTVLRPLLHNWQIEPDYVLVVAERAPIRGVVVDADGTPLSGAKLELRAADELRARLHRILDQSSSTACATKTDRAGRFALSDAPLAPGRLSAVHALAGFATLELANVDRERVRIVLSGKLAPEEFLHGTVVDHDGAPLDGARLALLDGTATSDASGAFDLALPFGKPSAPIRVVCKGYAPEEIPPRDLGPIDAATFDEPARVVLAPIDDSFWITGLVVDARDRPVAGALVQRMNATEFGQFVDERGYSADPTVEMLLEGRLRLPGAEVDVRGRFSVASLPGHRYTLRALDRRSMKMVEAGPFDAGSADVRLVIPDEPCYARVAGMVVDRSGAPLARARAWLYREVNGDGTEFEARDYADSAVVVTGADGRFELLQVAKAVWRLAVQAPGEASMKHVDLAAEPDVESLLVTANAFTHVQFDASASALDFRSAYFTDETGSFIWCTLFEGRGASSTHTLRLVDRRSAALMVPTHAKWLCLQKGSEIVRIPLELEPNGYLLVRP